MTATTPLRPSPPRCWPAAATTSGSASRGRVLAFGRGKRVPVVVTVDGGYTYRNTVAPMGGRY